MKVKVNGDLVQTEATTLAELLQEFDIEQNGKGTAVAVNDSVVPKTDWKDRNLEEEDRIEIIRATQGG